MWLVPPRGYNRAKIHLRRGQAEAGELQGFLVAADQGRVGNTKAPVGTMLLSPRPPNTRVATPPQCPHFHKACFF